MCLDYVYVSGNGGGGGGSGGGGGGGAGCGGNTCIVTKFGYRVATTGTNESMTSVNKPTN